jgi:hypothetical protein
MDMDIWLSLDAFWTLYLSMAFGEEKAEKILILQYKQ